METNIEEEKKEETELRNSFIDYLEKENDVIFINY